MSSKKIREEDLRLVSNLIRSSEYSKAVEALQVLDQEFVNDKLLAYNKCGFLIDIGSALDDIGLIKKGIDCGLQFVDQTIRQELKANLNYNLANGYHACFILEEYGNLEKIPQSENLQKSKYHYREAIKHLSKSDSDLGRQLWVNYGNCLDHSGRCVESFFTYDEALKFDPKFSMAIGNKAMAMQYFANISGKYKGAMYAQAYQAIKSIIDDPEIIRISGPHAKKNFENVIARIDSSFKDKSLLTKDLKHSKYKRSGKTDFEKFYLDFCSRNNLFLNFHIHFDQCESSIVDPIFITLISDAKDPNAQEKVFKLAKYINQIKEDYAVARLLLVQSMFRRKDFDEISERTALANTLDYSNFNLYIGLLKASYKEVFNILDKIAFFINDYYKIGIPEEKIYFTSIWQKDNKIRDEILKSRNVSLYALYDVYLDFKSGYLEKIKRIRNALTHRKLVIFDSILTDWDEKDDEGNIGYDTMVMKTLELFQLVKSSIIYLVNFVNNEERRKSQGRASIDLPLDTSQFLY